MNFKFFSNIYDGKTILITGHTGFKGSWLSLWLKELGANIVGYSLLPKYSPCHFDLLDLKIISYLEDINEFEKLNKVFKKHNPDLVFHLAAQPLVIYSYENPLETYKTNILGTANILECVRALNKNMSVVIVTSDKCYENKEWHWSYRENDSLGGIDPYSNSKACAEFITRSYRKSFFDICRKKDKLVATARAGNVIGGGDWSDNRLMPDIVRHMFENKKLVVRNPYAIRPWQHVLESLSGYLLLGEKLLQKKKEHTTSYNFGPVEVLDITVVNFLNIIKKYWKKIIIEDLIKEKTNYEPCLLKLDSSKSLKKLNWMPVWSQKKSIIKTVEWYESFYHKNSIISKDQLYEYIDDSKKKGISWTKY